MAKSKKDSFKSQLQKKPIKKELPSTEQIEKITEKVYKNASLEKKEPSQRTTIDIPKSLHIAAKMESMKDGVSLKEFILKLMREELKKRGVL